MPALRNIADLKNLYRQFVSGENSAAMMANGNIVFWLVLAGVALALFKVVATLIGSMSDKRIRRKCRRNHGRVISRRAERPVVRLSARVPRPSAS